MNQIESGGAERREKRSGKLCVIFLQDDVI